MTKAIKVVWSKLTPEMIAPGTVSIGVRGASLQLDIHRLLIAIAADWKTTTD